MPHPSGTAAFVTAILERSQGGEDEGGSSREGLNVLHATATLRSRLQLHTLVLSAVLLTEAESLLDSVVADIGSDAVLHSGRPVPAAEAAAAAEEEAAAAGTAAASTGTDITANASSAPTTLLYNEYVVYDTSQVVIRFLLRVRFNFNA